jgi:hypothetical protein
MQRESVYGHHNILSAIINTHYHLILPSYSSRKSCFHKTWLVSKLSHCCKYLFRYNIHNSCIIYTLSSLMTSWWFISSPWFLLPPRIHEGTISLSWHSPWQIIYNIGKVFCHPVIDLSEAFQCHQVWLPRALSMRMFSFILVEKKPVIVLKTSPTQLAVYFSDHLIWSWSVNTHPQFILYGRDHNTLDYDEIIRTNSIIQIILFVSGISGYIS